MLEILYPVPGAVTNLMKVKKNNLKLPEFERYEARIDWDLYISKNWTV